MVLLAATLLAGDAAAQLGPAASFSAYVRETPNGGFVAACQQPSGCLLPNATFTQAAASSLTGGGVDLRASSSMTVENGSHFSYFVASRALYDDVLFTSGPASSVTFQVMLSGMPTQSSPGLRSGSGSGIPAAYAAVNDHVRQHLHTIGSPDPQPLTLTYNLQPSGTTSIQWFLSAVSFIGRPADVTPGDPWSAWSSADYLSTLSVDYSTATFYSERNGTGTDLTSQVTFAFATATSTVPEPGTWALLGTGLLALGGVARWQRTHAGDQRARSW